MFFLVKRHTAVMSANVGTLLSVYLKGPQVPMKDMGKQTPKQMKEKWFPMGFVILHTWWCPAHLYLPLLHKVGPLPFITRFITPISRVITPVTHL